MGASRWFFTLSGTILLIGALAIGGKGLNFGIDFKSGTRIQTSFDRAVTQNEIRSVLAAEGHSATRRSRSSRARASAAPATRSRSSGSAPDKAPEACAAISKPKLGAETEHFSATSIGPTFGSTVANEAVIAIIASLLVISVYIAWRFEWKYAVPVLIALMHDLLITTGVYALTGREVTAATVAALLTILGYSMYDTIIVFDRIRENVPRMPRAAFSQIVNRSMSEVLTRSLATSFCTLLPVLALLLFGGETLQDFAFALLVGHRLRRLLVDLHRLARAHALEGTRALLPQPPRAARARVRRASRPTPDRRRRGGRNGAPSKAEAHTAAGAPVAPEEAGRAALAGGVRRSRARPRHRADRAARRSSRGRGCAGGAATRRSWALRAGAAAAATARTPRAQRASSRRSRSAAPRVSRAPAGRGGRSRQPADPTADATPEELVLKDKPRAPRAASAPRTRRHGRRR